jgi:hypothetical protein
MWACFSRSAGLRLPRGDRNRVRTIVSGGDGPVLAWTLSGGGVRYTRTIPARRGGRLSVTVSCGAGGIASASAAGGGRRHRGGPRHPAAACADATA